jgi:uncharacterized protein (TIGR03790 family)
VAGELGWEIAHSTGPFFKRGFDGIATAWTKQCRKGALLAIALGLASSIARADSTDAPTNSAPMPAPASTLPTPSLTAPPPPVTIQPDLTMRQDASPTNTPPEVPAVVPEISPETYRLLNPGGPNDLPAHLLVVYNINDPDSEPLARYYASRRNISHDRVLGIACPTTEEITRVQYENQVRSPIMAYMNDKDLMPRTTETVQIGRRLIDLLVATRNDIWAIVLIRGVPLKIAPDPSDEAAMESEPQLQTNAAAVDSELAMLPIFGLPKGGYVPNPFFENQINGVRQIGPQLSKSMILVTRLDGPSVADVRRMIDDSIEAEKSRLAGLAVVDSRGLTDVTNGYTIGDVWLRTAHDTLLKDGWTVKFDDSPAVLPTTDPCNQVALYLGWYNDTAVGPWVTAPNRFVPGAVAYHLHSFSANTVRSVNANWVGPLIEHGADATMGMVYEPYLALTPHEDIFARRLLQGDYFCEAAYASERGLSWMLTVVGDPLYRPFIVPLDEAMAHPENPHSSHDDWLLLQKVNRDLLADPTNNNPDWLVQQLNVPDAGPVAQEGLGGLLAALKNPAVLPQAEDAYVKAFDGSTLPIDRIRIGLKLAQLYSNQGEDARAVAEMDHLRKLYPTESKTFGVADTLLPTTTTPTAPKR